MTKEKSRLYENHNASLEEKIQKLEEENLVNRADTNAINRELDRKDREIEIWRSNNERLETLLAQKNIETSELSKRFDLKCMEVEVINDELEREKVSRDRMSLNLLNHE